MKTRLPTLAALVAPLAGCGPEPAASDLGQVTLALQTTGPSDAVYGLDATLELETPDGDARNPHVAVDAMGNAVVAWRQHETTHDGYVCHYEAASGRWGTPIPLESMPGDAVGPLVVADPAGNAIAAWSQVDGTGVSSVFARRYDAVEGSWGSEVPIETGSLTTRLSDLAVDAAGNAIAVMYGSDGMHQRALASRYHAATGWGSEGMLDPGGADSFNPRVAVDATGNAMVVWYRHDGTRYGAWVRRYDAATDAWSGEVQLDAGVAHAVIPQVAVDPSGNAMAVWYQFDGPLYVVLARRYDASSDAWGSPVQLDRDSVESFTPSVAVDAAGNGIVLWAQIEGGDYAIAARRYHAGAGTWGGEAVVASGMNNALEPRLALDAAGNAMALWSSSDGVGHGVLVSRYDATSDTWEPPLELARPISILPAHAVDPSGRAMVLWSQSDGARDRLFAARFY